MQLYLIWFGDGTLNEDESSIGGSLGTVALRSGGEIFRITEEPLGSWEMGLVSIVLEIVKKLFNRSSISREFSFYTLKL